MQSILAEWVTGCGCPVIKSAGHQPSPLHQQKLHQRGSTRMRPTRISRSLSKALKTSYLSPLRLFWDCLCELPFPLPPVPQEPHKHLTHINTFNSYQTPSKKQLQPYFTGDYAGLREVKSLAMITQCSAKLRFKPRSM